MRIIFEKKIPVWGKSRPKSHKPLIDFRIFFYWTSSQIIKKTNKCKIQLKVYDLWIQSGGESHDSNKYFLKISPFANFEKKISFNKKILKFKY